MAGQFGATFLFVETNEFVISTTTLCVKRNRAAFYHGTKISCSVFFLS